MISDLYRFKIGEPARRALKAIGCETLEDITRLTERELLALHGFGPKALEILKGQLHQRGLALREVDIAFCDSIHNNRVSEKKYQVKDGLMIKYHANGTTVWSKGQLLEGQPDGYWEWYRPDGTLKRSGYFDKGKPIGEWTTYDKSGNLYKVSRRE